MKKPFVFVVILTVTFAVTALGNGLNISGIGSRSAAMGDSYYAVADDYTAVFWCPAALAEVDGPEFNGTVLDIIPTATYKNAALDINTESTGGQNIFPNASFAHGGLAGGKFGYGFGAYASAGRRCCSRATSSVAPKRSSGPRLAGT